MTDKITTKYVYQTQLQSIISDLITLGFLCGSVWFNQTFCNGSYFLNGAILVMFFIFVLALISNDRVYSKELVKEIEQEEDL